VTFRYRDTETGAEKRCSLGALNFMHRFLQHVLPKRFVKIRYYGFFAPTLRARLSALRKSLPAAADLYPKNAAQRPQPLALLFCHPGRSPVPNAARPCFSCIPWRPCGVVCHESFPCSPLYQTSVTVSSRLPVCSCSSCFLHCLIMTSFLCKNAPFPCTILPLISGGYELAGFFRPDLLV